MESELNLKPCKNCGSSNLHHWKLNKFRDVECNDCSELLPEEEWQADNAREKLLRAENEKLRERLAIFERMDIMSFALKKLEALNGCTE